jgi:S1-C subfamily serine protease
VAELLQKVSNEMAELVRLAGPSVVRVEGRRRTPGSGIVWSADGLVLTANHVVKRDDNLMIGLADGQSVGAKVVGRDPSTDLALLQAEAGGLSAFTPAEAGTLGVGQFVLALGRPGRTVQATLGIVSGLGDAWRTGMGGQIDQYLQTDVIMYPGFSGGPLVEAGGRLIGLNTSGLGQGVSLAIPASTLSRVAGALQSHGRVRRGYLGVSTQRVRLPDEMAAAAGQKTGLLVISVESGSPAAEGGLLLGDTIVGLGGKPIQGHDDLLATLSGDAVGQKELVRVVRGGALQELTVKVGERD